MVQRKKTLDLLQAKAAKPQVVGVSWIKFKLNKLDKNGLTID